MHLVDSWLGKKQLIARTVQIYKKIDLFQSKMNMLFSNFHFSIKHAITDAIYFCRNVTICTHFYEPGLLHFTTSIFFTAHKNHSSP